MAGNQRAQKRYSSAAFGRNTRPPRTYSTGPVTQLIRWLTIAVGITVTVWVLVGYSSLPDEIPTHFNFAGRPDAWGPRASIFLLVGVFVVLIGALEWLSHSPRSFNYVGEITEENAQAMYRVGEQMIVWVNACTALLYAGIALSLLISPDLFALVTLGIIGMIGTMIAGIVLMVRASKS